MRTGSFTAMRGIAVMVLASGAVACGGDDAPTDGDPAAPPVIGISVNSYAPGQSPLETILPGMNANVLVSVIDPVTLAPVTEGVSAVANGIALKPSLRQDIHTVPLGLPPGARIDIAVTVNGVTYNATANQLLTFPELITPAEGAVWNVDSAQMVAWSSAPAGADAQHLLTMISPTNQWPSTMGLQLPDVSQSFEIPAGQLIPESYTLVVSVKEKQPFAGAHPLSSFSLFGTAQRNVAVVPAMLP